MKKAAYVLDLGSTKVVCMAASLDEEGRLRVDAYSVVPCRVLQKGAIKDLDEAADAIHEAVRAVEQEIGVDITALAVSMGGAHIQSMNSQGFVPIYPQSRAIRPEDVFQVIGHSRQIMMPADREQIMAIPREFRIDGSRGISRPVGMSGARLEVMTHVISAQSSAIHNIEKALNANNRKLQEVVAQGLASGLALVSPEQMEMGGAVVDIGGGTTDIAIFASGAVAYTSSIPIGAHHITTDLATLLKTTREEAERLKQEHGSALARTVADDDAIGLRQLDADGERPMQRKVLCEIIESRMREIGQLVQKEIEKSGHHNQLGAGAVLTGGGSLLRGAEASLSESLKHIKVRMATPKVVGTYSRKVQTPQFSTAIGMAKSVLYSEEQEFQPVSGPGGWKDRVRALKSMFGGKA
jgi:cell division protein FtsA